MAGLVSTRVRFDALVVEPPVQLLFAGHIPNRVQLGMATPADGNPYKPTWTEARAIIGQPIYEARRFVGNWITAASFNSMINEAVAANALPNISFKPNGITFDERTAEWLAIASGERNADLITLFNLAVSQRTAGPGGTRRPFVCSFHHEPQGDGDLSRWAQMQEFCTWFFAGRRGGTATSPYDPAHDVSDIMSWGPVGNGFWWRTATPSASAAIAYPQSLIDALRICGGIGQPDFYDADYVNQAGAMTDVSLRTPDPTGIRTSVRLVRFTNWWRARNGGAVGCGEFGVIDGDELLACWNVMKANADIWVLANYFNSGQNSDHEWRLLQHNYPAQNPTGDAGLVDFGGNAQSQGRLDAFKQALRESSQQETFWWVGYSTSREGLNGSTVNKQSQMLLRAEEMATATNQTAAAVRAAAFYHGYNTGCSWDATALQEFQFAASNDFGGIMMNQKPSALTNGLANWASGAYDANFLSYLQSVKQVGLPRNVIIMDHEPNNNVWTALQQQQWREGTARFMKITAEFNDPTIVYSTCLVPNTGGNEEWNPRPALNALMGSVAAAQAVMDKTFAGADPYPEYSNGVAQTLEGRMRTFIDANKSWGFTKFCLPEVGLFHWNIQTNTAVALSGAQQAKRMRDELWTWCKANNVLISSYFDVTDGWTGTGSTTDGTNPRGDSRAINTTEELIVLSQLMRNISPNIYNVTY